MLGTVNGLVQESLMSLLSLRGSRGSHQAAKLPRNGTPFCEKCHFCVFEPSESGFQLFRMHWRARVFLVRSIGTGFQEKIQLSRGVGQARALHDAERGGTENALV